AIAFALIARQGAFADDNESEGCVGLPSQAQSKAALVDAVTVETSGLNFQMWATVVDRDGVVCAVAFSGADRGSQWPGSRVISAQKANTANAFSLDGLALSTANLYSAVQPGGSLYGLQHSNPVDTGVAYQGPSSRYGSATDPMVGHKIGGVNVFGGGLGLYAAGHRIVGGVGVSGDTSCADRLSCQEKSARLNFRFEFRRVQLAIIDSMRTQAMLALLFATVASAQPVEDALRARIGDFQGTVSLYAKNLDTGSTTGIRESDAVRTAST